MKAMSSFFFSLSFFETVSYNLDSISDLFQPSFAPFIIVIILVFVYFFFFFTTTDFCLLNANDATTPFFPFSLF